MLAFDPAAQDRPNAFSCDLGAEVGVQVVIAKKGAASTSDRMTFQAHDRSDADWARFLEQVGPFRRSARPQHMGTGSQGGPIAGHDGAWRSCGWW